MYYLLAVVMFSYKWMWCSWKHRKHRCCPQVPKHWHCALCHPCGEVFDYVIGHTEDGQPLNRKKNIVRQHFLRKNIIK